MLLTLLPTAALVVYAGSHAVPRAHARSSWSRLCALFASQAAPECTLPPGLSHVRAGKSSTFGLSTWWGLLLCAPRSSPGRWRPGSAHQGGGLARLAPWRATPIQERGRQGEAPSGVPSGISDAVSPKGQNPEEHGGGSLAGRNRSVMPARPPVAFHPGGTPGGATRGEGSHGRGSLGPSEDGRRCPTVHAGRRWGGTGASVGRRSVPAPDEGGSSSRGGGAEAYSIAWRGGGSNRATRIMNFRWSSAASSLVVWYLSRKK
jgi:hypothetical protein